MRSNLIALGSIIIYLFETSLICCETQMTNLYAARTSEEGAVLRKHFDYRGSYGRRLDYQWQLSLFKCNMADQQMEESLV